MAQTRTSPDPHTIGKWTQYSICQTAMHEGGVSPPYHFPPVSYRTRARRQLATPRRRGETFGGGESVLLDPDCPVQFSLKLFSCGFYTRPTLNCSLRFGNRSPPLLSTHSLVATRVREKNRFTCPSSHVKVLLYKPFSFVSLLWKKIPLVRHHRTRERTAKRNK